MAEPAVVVDEPVVEEPATPTVPTPTPTPAEDKLLPTSEVERIVKDRLARDRKDRPSDDEIAELRQKAAAHDQAAEASKTELEKSETARQKAEKLAADTLQVANDRLKTAEAKAELAKAGVTNVDGALRALDKTGLTVEDDGTVSGVEEAVKSLLEAVPEFVGKAGGAKPVDQGARGTGTKDGQVTAAQLETMSAEEITKATAEGRMADLLS